jgi:hypothetical protein
MSDDEEIRATSYSEAHQLGVSKYFTGKPCKYGHISERYAYGGCVTCLLERQKEHWTHQEFREKYSEWSKIYRQTSLKSQATRKRNREKLETLIAARARAKRRWQNPEVRIANGIYVKQRRETNLQFKIAINLRSRINLAIYRSRTAKKKSGSAVKDLGCSIEDFKSYIESQFQPGMSWENWGRDTWHLDHKLPLISFDLTNRDQFLQAVHYTNYQPLWAFDNLQKHGRILKEKS